MSENYLEIKLIGEGAFSNLYEGINQETNETVALKKIDKSRLNTSSNPDYLIGTIQNEKENMKLCECENTVKFYEYYEDDDYFVIVMELCDTNLSDYLKKRDNFTLDEIFEIFSNLNKAFKIMHEKNILHRDIKLENILLKFTNKEKTKFVPKLCDFGFSKQIKIDGKNTRLGTPVTMAPEILKGSKYDSKTDLWSLGVIIYYCYFKEYPYFYKQLPNILRANKVEYKKPDNIFFSDLIDKLLIVDPKNRITWEEYFNHPFFKVFSFREFNIGFINTNLKYYKAKYKEDENNIKNVLIKEMKQNNLEHNFHYKDLKNHKLLSKNENILKLITPIEFKDANNKQIIVFIYESDDNCIPLGEYCKNHNFEENEIFQFHNNFFEIFKKCSNSNMFISIYSFIVYQNGKIKLIDFGLNKKFLSNEEIKIYYAPNEEEMLNSENPSKTCLMNYGITILKMTNNNDDNIFYENNKFSLKSKRTISSKFNSFLLKCVFNDINIRPDWDDLKNEEFLKLDNNYNQSLLNEKQFDFFLNYFSKKYKVINEYYNNIFDINNLDNISENEDFLLLTIYEIKIIKEILSDENTFNKNNNQITLLALSQLKDNNNNFISKININSQKCLNMKLITNSLCQDKKTKFINEIEEIINKLIYILININQKTNGKKYVTEKNEISNDFLQNFIQNCKIFKLQDFCLSFIYNINNDFKENKNINYNKACIELNFTKYIIEFILFFKESIKENDEKSLNKKYDTKDELLKDITNIFNENDNNNYIIISLIYDKIITIFEELSNDELNNLVKDNKSSLSQLIQFYPFLMKMIYYFNSKIA